MTDRLFSFVGSVLTVFSLFTYGVAVVAIGVFLHATPGLTQKYGVLSYTAFLLLWAISLVVLNMAALAYIVKRRSKADFMELTRGQGYSIILPSRQFAYALWAGTTAIARNAAYSRPIRLWATVIKYVGSLNIFALLILLILIIANEHA